jgi:hypothetical protein
MMNPLPPVSGEGGIKHRGKMIDSALTVIVGEILVKLQGKLESAIRLFTELHSLLLCKSNVHDLGVQVPYCRSCPSKPIPVLFGIFESKSTFQNLTFWAMQQTWLSTGFVTQAEGYICKIKAREFKRRTNVWPELADWVSMSGRGQ